MAFSTLWLNSSFTYGDEKLLVQWSSIFKRVILQMDEDPPKKDYLFINLAYDKTLIPREEGTGKEVITDRQLLASFFEVLKKHHLLERKMNFACYRENISFFSSELTAWFVIDWSS